MLRMHVLLYFLKIGVVSARLALMYDVVVKIGVISAGLALMSVTVLKFGVISA